MDIFIAIIIICIAIYGVCTSDHLIKSIICLNIVQAAIILLFIIIGSKDGQYIPIMGTDNAGTLIKDIVDPLPQALMITAIVISASITALALMCSIKIYHYYGTLNWSELIDKDVNTHEK